MPPADQHGSPRKTIVASRSEADTHAIASELARSLHAGDVLLLTGDLGAGKTAFVRGVAAGLGIDPDEVSSPTFTLVHEYRGQGLTLYHADLYRLGQAATGELGLEELGVKDGVLAIEWPDRLTHDIPGALSITLETIGGSSRRITIARAPIPSGSSALPS